MVTTATTTTYRVRLHCQGTTTQQGHQCRRTVRTTAEYPFEHEARAASFELARYRGWETQSLDGPFCPLHRAAAQS